jgi:hypothetical protein
VEDDVAGSSKSRIEIAVWLQPPDSRAVGRAGLATLANDDNSAIGFHRQAGKPAADWPVKRRCDNSAAAKSRIQGASIEKATVF